MPTLTSTSIGRAQMETRGQEAEDKTDQDTHPAKAKTEQVEADQHKADPKNSLEKALTDQNEADPQCGLD